jgi:hypothetical protein
LWPSDHSSRRGRAAPQCWGCRDCSRSEQRIAARNMQQRWHLHECRCLFFTKRLSEQVVRVGHTSMMVALIPDIAPGVLSSVDFFARSQWNAVGSRGRDHRLSKVVPASGRGADAQKCVPTTTCLHLRAPGVPASAGVRPEPAEAGTPVLGPCGSDFPPSLPIWAFFVIALA